MLTWWSSLILTPRIRRFTFLMSISLTRLGLGANTRLDSLPILVSSGVWQKTNFGKGKKRNYQRSVEERAWEQKYQLCSARNARKNVRCTKSKGSVAHFPIQRREITWLNPTTLNSKIKTYNINLRAQVR